MTRELCRCGRPLIERASDLEATCGECQYKPDYCSCEPLERPAGRVLAVTDLEPAAELVEPPVLACGDMLYLGGVHTLTGPPDCGKTTLACWWMLRAIRDGGRVLFLDEEGGREIVTERFQALGARRGERIGYIEFPSRSWNDGDVAMLADILDERKPVVVAWDSSAAFLARAGLDENAAADVTRFYARVLAPAARLFRAAVLAIDHDTKGGEPSRYARGSGAKLAATDVAYKVVVVKAFSKTESGSSKLIVTKDRRGWLERGHEVGFLAGTGDAAPLTVSITPAAPDPDYPDLTPAQAKLLEALDGAPATAAELVGRVVATHGHGLKRETVSRALGALVDARLADRIDQGPGKAVFWMRFGWSEPVTSHVTSRVRHTCPVTYPPCDLSL